VIRLVGVPARVAGWPERHPGGVIAAIGLLFALAYGASLVLLPKPDGRIVVGDALHHYVQLRSIVFDGDLHFRNEYMRLYNLKGGEIGTEWLDEPTPTGRVRNLMPVGPALLWAPAFLLVSAGVWVAGLAGVTYPLDGYARLFQATAGLSGVAAAIGGTWCAYRAAAAVFDRATALWATLALWLASSAVYYSVISPTYSHASSMLAVGVFWAAWIGTRDRQDVGRYALLGGLVGVAALMRWQDAILMVVLLVDVAWGVGERGLRAAAVRLGAAVAGAAAGFAPQMIVWTVLYGAPLAIPQGSDFMRWTSPALWAVLFSDNHGLFTWTPVVALAVAGLVPLARRAPRVGVAAAAFVVISWYVNAAVADWWAGEAFGARRFLSCYPVFVLGFAALLYSLRAGRVARAGIAAVFIAHTFLLLVQYQAFMHGLRTIVPYPRGVDGLWLARFRAPFDLLAWWAGR
jgi:hypothetical protein